ncbi:hypothetical protein K0U83_13305, partial [bacterium]|nr:hypothetical protein [bacterium]
FPCIASACMAWRRDAAEQRRGPIVERVCALPGSSRPTGDDWGYEASDPNRASAGGDWVRFETVTEHLTGYCGLAGAPQ